MQNDVPRPLPYTDVCLSQREGIVGGANNVPTLSTVLNSNLLITARPPECRDPRRLRIVATEARLFGDVRSACQHCVFKAIVPHGARELRCSRRPQALGALAQR